MSANDEKTCNAKTGKENTCNWCKSTPQAFILCNQCKQTYFCSFSCQDKFQAQHKTMCDLIHPLIGTKGYNDRISYISNETKQSLILSGFVNITQVQEEGVIMFHRHKSKEFNDLQLALKKAPQAKLLKNVFDKKRENIIYCYPVPSTEIIEDWDVDAYGDAFINLLKNKTCYQYLIPVIELLFDDAHDLRGMSFYVLSLSEQLRDVAKQTEAMLEDIK